MAEPASVVPTFGNFIGGEWRPAESGRTFESRNPADTRELIGHFAASDAADVAAAIRAAEDALPGWRNMPAPKRGEIMYDFGALLAQHKERLAREMTREMGKVLAEARGDVQEGIDIAYLMAGEGRRMFGDTAPSELPNKWAMSIRQPIGIAAIITPWNFPIAIPCWKMTAALISGNSVGAQAGERHAALRGAARRAHARGRLPAWDREHGHGLRRGRRHAARREPRRQCHLVHRQRRDRPRHRHCRGAERVRRLSLELGGKNAIVVMADADLDLAVDGILWSAFGTTGQRCTACSRLVVDEQVADDLVGRLVDRAASLRLGLWPRADDRRWSADQHRSGRQGRRLRRRGDGRGRATGRRRSISQRPAGPGERALLQPDHPRWRQAHGPRGPGGDLRPGPIRDPRRWLRGSGDGRELARATASRPRSTPATRTPRSGRCATSRRASCTSTRARSAPRRTCRSAA